MKLDGHREISNRAVKEFLAEPGNGRYAADLYAEIRTRAGTTKVAVGEYAVQRDLNDVFTLGHWSNFAQKHHFMRRFDGQSQQGAYDDACEWILSNAVKFANAVLKGDGPGELQALGNAMHAVEDSFASGHAEREKAGGPTAPGAIKRIKMYAGSEKEGHSHGDKTWRDGSKLSLEGELAKNAAKALVAVIFAEVERARASKQKSVNGLSGWIAYREKWLRAGKLSGERDGAYDLVDDFYNGVVWGDTNTAFNFDEEGMANAIWSKLGDDTRKIRAAFNRLYEYHTVDSDDVAEIYVNKLRKNPSSKTTRAVLGDKLLVGDLVKIMDEGWTSSGEQDCIKFLQGGGR